MAGNGFVHITTSLYQKKVQTNCREGARVFPWQVARPVVVLREGDRFVQTLRLHQHKLASCRKWTVLLSTYLVTFCWWVVGPIPIN